MNLRNKRKERRKKEIKNAGDSHSSIALQWSVWRHYNNNNSNNNKINMLLSVVCGELSAELDTERFGPGGRSECIRLSKESPWVSLSKFEDVAGKGASHNWKRTIRYQGKTLHHWLQQENPPVKLCAKACCCALCGSSNNAASAASAPANTHSEGSSGASTPVVNHPAVKALKTASAAAAAAVNDSDADSGICMTNKEPLRVDVGHDYTTMIQEALLALSSAASGGASILNVLLYLLNNYDLSDDDIDVVKTKVKNGLSFLARMGVVERLDSAGNPNSEESDLEEEVEVKREDEAKEEEEVKVEEPKRKKKKKPSTEDPTKLKQKPKKKKVIVKSSKPENKFLSRPQRLSPALAAICKSSQLSRHDVVKGVWKYVKEHKLQDPNDKTIIVCDDKLKAVVKKKRIPQTELLKYLGKHMVKIS